jgi:autotransporter-associated beta strand protein
VQLDCQLRSSVLVEAGKMTHCRPLFCAWVCEKTEHDMRFRNYTVVFQILIVVAVVSTGVANAATQTWTNDQGNFSWDGISTNWTGVAWTPGSDAYFGSAGTGTITVSGLQSVGNITFASPGYTVNSGTLSLAGAYSIYGSSSGTITSALSNSGMQLVDSSYTGQVTFGRPVNVSGFQVNGGTAVINGILNSSNNFFYVGNGDGNNGGTGGNSNLNTMVLNNGAQVSITGGLPDTFVIARDNNAQGAVVQNGGILNFNPSSGHDLLISAGPSIGIYNISGGTLNSPSDRVAVGNYGGNGILNVTGGLVAAAPLVVGLGGGSGTLNLSGGTINSGGYFSSGLAGNGSASISVSSGLWNHVGDMTLDENSNSLCMLTQTGGTINETNGTLFFGRSGGGQGVYSINNGVFKGGNLQLGSNGSSGLVLVSGGQFSLGTGNYMAIGLGGGNSYGNVYVTGGAVSLGFLSVHENSTAPSSSFYQSAGTVAMNTSNGIAIGRSGGGTGYYNLSGGLFNVGTNDMNLCWQNYNGTTGETGVLNVSGGSITQSGINGVHLSVNATSTSTVNQTGGFFGVSAASADGLAIGWNTSSNGTYNLAGGVLQASKIQTMTGSTGTFNINGGTIQANASSGSFLTGPLNVYVHGAGAVIDTSGQNITVQQPLLAPNVSDSGAVTIAVSDGGTGYLAPPTVTITGGSGTPATAIANLDGSGHVVSVTVANPGDYTDLTNVAVSFSGGFGTSGVGTSASASVNFANLASGGLRKAGSGALTLGGNNTYTGATTVNSGALYLNGVNNTTSISVARGATLGGLGSAPSALVSVANGGILDLSQNTASTFSTAAMSFAGSSTIKLGGLANYAVTPFISTGTLSTTNPIAINSNLGSSTVLSGTYDLINYAGEIGGSGSSVFSVSVQGLGARQTATLVNANSQLDVVIVGSTPYWNGTASDWRATNAWTLHPDGTPATFLAGDSDVFDDTSASGNVTLNTANVNPTTVTFANNSLAYSLSGTFGIVGSASVSVIGAAPVTISNSNSYTGGTILTNGQLNINNASALGTGSIAITNGTLDNTSGAAITLSTSNPQTWNGSLTFLGSNPLNLGAGAVSIGGTSQTVNLSGSTLTVGGPISGAATAVSLVGSGTLFLPSTATFGSTTINGPQAVLVGSSTLGSTYVLDGALHVSGAASAAGLQINGGSVVVSGSLSVANAYFFVGNGGTHNGVFGTSGTMTINNGATISVSGDLGDNVVIGRDSGSGVVNQNGGVFNDNSTNGYLYVGATNNPNTNAVYNLNAGTLILNNNALGIGLGAGPFPTGQGTFNQSGGLVTAGGPVIVGLIQGVGVLNQTAGTIASGGFQVNGGTAFINSTVNTTNGYVYVGNGGNNNGGLGKEDNPNTLVINSGAQFTISGNLPDTFVVGRDNSATGIVTQNGGLLNFNPNSYHDVLIAAGQATGTYNMNGGTLNLNGNGLGIACYGTPISGIFNLNGGLVQVNHVWSNTAQGTFNFSGGTLQATADNSNFFSGVGVTNVDAGGAVIDANGHTITIGENLADGGGGLTKVGSGTLILSGTNTYTGGTMVEGGTLILTNNMTVPDGSALTVGNPMAFGDAVIPSAIASSAVAPVPEPGAAALLCVAGFAALSVYRMRRHAR